MREIIRQACAELGIEIIRGYVSATSGSITDDLVLQYLANHMNEPTDVNRSSFSGASDHQPSSKTYPTEPADCIIFSNNIEQGAAG